jgi:hypothetical protein
MTTTLAVNVSASLTYNSLSLATATKTSSATCLATNGAKFESMPTLTATSPTSYKDIGAAGYIGSVNAAKKYWLYLENYDNAVDYVCLVTDFALTVDALGITYNALAVEYVVNDVVYHTSTDTWYRCIQVNGTDSVVKTPGSDTLYWAPLATHYVPFGRAVVFVTQGAFHLIAVSAPTIAQCKVVAIQDEA